MSLQKYKFFLNRTSYGFFIVECVDAEEYSVNPKIRRDEWKKTMDNINVLANLRKIRLVRHLKMYESVVLESEEFFKLKSHMPTSELDSNRPIDEIDERLRQKCRERGIDFESWVNNVGFWVENIDRLRVVAVF